MRIVQVIRLKLLKILGILYKIILFQLKSIGSINQKTSQCLIEKNPPKLNLEEIRQIIICQSPLPFGPIHI